MNKQISLKFFFTLIFIFVFASSVNAITRGIKKRQTCDKTAYCTFQDGSSQEAGGELHFSEQQSMSGPVCDVVTFGQMNFFPGSRSSELRNYDLHITLTSCIPDASFLDLEDWVTPIDGQDTANVSFFNTLSEGIFPQDFFTASNKYCCVFAYDAPSGDQVLGTAPVMVV
ncbi:2632_t:CDS:1 [Ambispora leptoticha]|uniref:2632_t:CDS:1 n=1 Tax=Ambispora leptoticha TaxID=144679 RepID=A0A9N8ZR41_9GLOM|nr:2632_t:CDS:1 [Ambispora leptoticha]